MACQDGYFGSSCNPCPPGFYGAECAGRCFPECADVDCDSVSGCLNNTAISTSGMALRNMFTITLAVVPETKDASIPDEPPTRGDINTNYILAGGGILIVLFLCVLSLQIYTCKRAKSTKIQFCEHNACREMRLPDESANDIQKENSPTPSMNYRARKNPNIHQPTEPAYHDIDESMELEQSPVLSNASQEYERSSQKLLTKLSYSPLSIRDSFLFKQLVDLQVEPLDKRDENNPDLYLQPISIEENNKAITE